MSVDCRMFLPFFTAFLSLFNMVFPAFAGDRAEVIALVQKSAPKYFLEDPFNKGLCGDIYEQLKERLSGQNIDLKISRHFTPIKRILETLKTGTNALFCGGSRDAEREKSFLFSSKPLYEVSNILVTHRQNSENPTSIEDLINSDATVGTYFGTGSSEFLKRAGVDRVNERFQSVVKGLQSVASGEVDYFFYHDLGLLYSLSRSNLALRPVPTKFRSYYHWMMYSGKMAPDLQKKVDLEVSRMINEGVIAGIRKRYESKQD